jgi:hypothetical protein
LERTPGATLFLKRTNGACCRIVSNRIFAIGGVSIKLPVRKLLPIAFLRFVTCSFRFTLVQVLIKGCWISVGKVGLAKNLGSAMEVCAAYAREGVTLEDVYLSSA